MSAQHFIQDARTTMEGAGAEVHRLFPLPGFMNFDPFVLWDHFTVSGDAGFPDHPHRGFEAITYMFEGGMQHTDNLGNQSTVYPGGAQRFTAGRGIVHSEMPEGAVSRGIQLWINLPQRLKDLPPAYQQVNADELPVTETNGVTIRTLVGADSPLELQTPVLYQDISFAAGSKYRVEPSTGQRGLIYLVDGEVSINDSLVNQGQALFIDNQQPLLITATTDARLMLALGQPHGEPIRQHGPFVD